MMVSRPHAFLFVLVALSFAIGRPLPAQLTPSSSVPQRPAANQAEPAPSITYRRIFVPEDKIPAVAGKGFLPMLRHDFEQLERLLKIEGAAPSDVASAAVYRIDAYATFVEGVFLRGQAIFEIERRRPGRAAVPLAPLGIAVSSPYWKETTLPALAGLDREGRYVVITGAEKQLACSWSARGEREGPDDVTFAMVLPHAPIRRLWIDLPQELQLSATGGIASEVTVWPDGGRDPLQLAPPDPGTRRWRVDAQAQGIIGVRVAPRQFDLSTTAALRQTTTCDLAPQGVTVTDEIRLFIQGRPLDHLTLRLDPQLQLSAARLNDHVLPFELAAEDSSLVTLRFPQPIIGAGHYVRLSAKAPVTLNEEWSLPMVRPQGAEWRSGQIHLRVAESLTLQHIAPHECGQTQTETLSAVGGGRALTFRNYSPDAQLVLVAARRQSQVKAAVGETIEFGPTSAAATLVFDLEAIHGERFIFSAEVAPEWIIDSLTAIPSEGSAEQNLLDRETVPSTVQPGEPLEIRLRRSLNPQRDVRLVIKAHRRITGETPTLSGHDLRIVALRDVEETFRVVAVEPESPYQVTLAEDWRVTRLAPGNLPAHITELISPSPASLVFEDHPAAVGLRAELVSATPNFAAEIAMDVLARHDSLREKYQIRISPVSSRVDRLRVHFSARRSGPLQWSWNGGPEQPVAARRVDDDMPDEGETWEVLFDRARDTPVTLSAERVTEINSVAQLAFASLPQASSQKGELIIRSTPGVALSVQAQGLSAVPSPATNASEYPDAYGVFRFEPAQQPGAQLSIASERSDAPAAWARLGRVSSYYPVEGVAHHTAEYVLENTGRAAVGLSAPANVTLRRIEVNGQEIPLNYAALRSQFLPVPLPENVRFPQVKIDYVSAPQRIRVKSLLHPPAPSLDIPVLVREWFIFTAPSLSIAAIEGGATRLIDDPAWEQRLFGFLRPTTGTRRGEPVTETSGHAESGVMRPEWSATQGWITKRLLTTGDAAPSVVVYRRDVFVALGACVFLLAVVAVVWLMSRHPAWGGVLGGVFAVLALIAPAPYYLLATALFLSAPIAAIFWLFSERPRSRISYPSAEAASTTVSQPLGFCVALAIAINLMTATGPDVYAQPESTEAVLPVLIPIDREGQISRRDKYVYLPESLFSAFRSAARRFDAPPLAWLLKSVDYELACEWRPEDQAIACDRVNARLQLEVLTAPTRVVLPLPWISLIQKDSVRLDGGKIDVTWDNAQKLMAFEVEQSGGLLLTMVLRPQLTSEGGRSRMELNNPPTANANVSVRFPADLHLVELGGAQGFVVHDDSKGEITAELGASPSFNVSWPSVVNGNVRARRPTPVEQFLWLHVQPDALVLDAKWRFLGSGDEISELEILADDNLQLLPSTARGLAGFNQVRRNDKQVLRLHFDQPRQTPFEFQVSLVVQGGAGVGRPAAPQLEIQKVDVARRWLAVSLDPSLELRNAKTENVQPLPEDGFRAEWGDAPAAPLLAYRLLRETSSWTAEVRPRRAPMTGAAELEAAYGRETVRVFYRADLDSGNDPWFVLRLSAPKELHIERITVNEGAVNRVDHWAQRTDGQIAIFLNGRVNGAFTLELQGALPASVAGECSLPHFSLHDMTATNTICRIYRDADVNVHLGDLNGWTQVASVAPGSYTPERGRLVAALTHRADLVSPLPQVTLEVSPNQPQLSNKQLTTTLTPANDRWLISAELSFNAHDGVVDFVRLEMPHNVVGPITIDPPARWETVELTQSRRQILLIRPDQSLSGACRIRVNAALQTPPGESLQAPEIEPLDLGDVVQYLVLPRQWRGKPLVWEPVGLRVEPLPHDELRVNDEQTIVYRVVNKPQYRAVVRNVEQAIGEPQVRLMDVRIALHPTGRFHGDVTYDLEPAGLRACYLEMPSGTELIHAAVTGRAMAPRKIDRNRYLLDLGGERLPVRIVVVYSGAAQPSDTADHNGTGQRSLRAPVLRGMPVERTLWTVSSIDGGQRIALTDSTSKISPERQELLRLRTLGSVLDLPSDLEAERTAEELERWYAAWARRWQIVRRRLAREDIQRTAPETSVAFESLDDEQAILARRYGGEHLHEQIRADLANAPEERDLASARDAVRAAFQGGARTLTVQVFTAKDPSTSRWLFGGAAFSFALALAYLGLWLGASEYLARWFPLTCVVLGLAWWLWLTPALIGLAFIGAGLWFSLRGAAWIAPYPVDGLR